MIEQRIEQDLKTALLSRDSLRVSTLRTVKSSLLYLKVELGKRDVGLTDDEVISILSKEAKKRQESADLYLQGGNQTYADKELAEKAMIEEYLPAQLTENEVEAIVNDVMKTFDSSDKSAMGKIIGEVKKRTTGAADGALIARIVKEKIN